MTTRKRRPVDFEREFEVVLNLHNSGADDRALKEAESLLQKHGNQPSLHGLIALIHFGRDEYAQASEHFRSVTILSPHSEKASLGLFHSLWSQDMRVDALEEMKRYTSLHKSQEYAQMLDAITQDLKQHKTNTT